MPREGFKGLACAVVLAGCGGGGQVADLPLPYFDRGTYGTLLALPEATDLPRGGRARYEGGFVADIREADITPSGRVEGGLTLDLDFADASTTLPVAGRLHDISGDFLGERIAIGSLAAVPGQARLVLTRHGARRSGVLEAAFGAELPLAGEGRRLDLMLGSPLRGAGGQALAGPVSGTILTAPYTDQPHVLTGQFHATTD